MKNQIYLLREREFINTDEPIYKIGRSTTTIKIRMYGYPKGSELIYLSNVIDCVSLERKLIDLLNDKFIKRKDIGNEYFEGNLEDMLKVIRDEIELERINHNKLNNLQRPNEIIKNDQGSENIEYDKINNYFDNYPTNNYIIIDPLETEEDIMLHNVVNKTKTILSYITEKKDVLEELLFTPHDTLLYKFNPIKCDEEDVETKEMYNKINLVNHSVRHLVLNEYENLYQFYVDKYR
jgi:hypothetical protein